MNVLKRSMISVCRQPIKSGIFVLLIILLGALAFGGISVRQAIINTDQNLRQRMPAVVTITQAFDYEASQAVYEETGEWSETGLEALTPELIREIGSLSQVRVFDYTIDISWGVSGAGLSMWANPDFQSPMLGEYDEDLGVRLRIAGVSNPDFLDIFEGLLELTDGRSFYEAEFVIDEAPFPALIASGFAEANGLNTGDVFNSQVVVLGDENEDGEREVITAEEFPLEVIGIFTPFVSELAEGADIQELFQADRHQMMLQHRIYVPNAVAEMMFNVRADNPGELDEVFLQNFFILNDPMDINDFVLEVENLPGSWQVIDLSSGFHQISASMENMKEVANLIAFFAVGAALIVISLSVLLFLRDRQHEIGVYLALGEKKKNIVTQIVMELMPLAILGITVSLLVGSFLATSISETMLRQDMAQENHMEISEANPLEELGYRFELTIEEMLESYEIRLDVRSVLMFYGIGLGIILVSILAPITLVINVEPKKVLYGQS